MSSAGEDDADAVLSDVEGDEPVPIVIKSDASPDELSPERFRELLAELDRERQAREAAENSKSELQTSFNRLKVLTHEAIRKRDELGRQKDEALREKEELLRSKGEVSVELAEANRVKEEALKERDNLARQVEEATKARDGLRSEMESSAHMLVTGIEKISGKVSNFKNFSSGGLPRSQKYSGLPAVAYGVIKRTNDIVEELVKHIDSASKSRDEARGQVEQRNYEIAIEVSQLEASISGLRDEVEKKSYAIENFEKAIAEKDGKILEIEKEMSEKVHSVKSEASELRQLAGEYHDKLRYLETKMETQKDLLIDQLNYVSKIHDQIYNVIKIVDGNNSDQSEFSESLFLPQGTDMEGNIRACVAGMESIHELMRIVSEKTRDLVEGKGSEVKHLNETIAQLVKEKEQIGSLLRGALSKRMTSDPSSKTSELFHVAENGLREAGIDFKFDKLLVDGKVSASPDKENSLETEDEIYTLAGALENIVKTSQLEIIYLQHSVDELRAESSSLKECVEAQAKELNHRKHRIEELEEKERVANESVEGLMLDITAAEEEITRWKVAAEEEAAAGRAVEQELLSQLSAIRQELEEAKQAIMEAEKKLGSKEEIATAAMAARDAAEKSLRMADTRATSLRERVEELNHQLEQLESQQDIRSRNKQHRYACWPWQWLGLDFVGAGPSNTEEQQGSNEMELSEPLL